MPRFIMAILLAWLILASPALAQDPNKRIVLFEEGAEVFCQILHHEGLLPIRSLHALADDPKDTLLIVFGNPVKIGALQQATDGLAQFLKLGGNLLIVTDYYFDDLDITIGGRKITQPARSAYRGEAQCPWLPCAMGGAHPLFRSLHKGIATNNPSHVVVGPLSPGVEPLLEFPNGVKPAPIYMVGSPGDAPPQGRVLVIAGQGMFLNGMMLQTDKQDKDKFDNDNFEFAKNAIRWLREGPNGTARTRALLMVDGGIVTDFDMNLAPAAGLPSPQIPIPPVQAINRLIRGMEEERLFEKMLRGLLGDHFDRVIGILFAVATFGMLLYAAKKFLEGRSQHDTAVPRMVGAAPPLGAGLSRGQQRQRTLYQQPNAVQASKQLALAWLGAEFGVPPSPAMALQARGFLWARWNLQRQADWVLGLAAASEPVRATRHDFAALVDALPQLSRAVAAGQLALLVDGKTVRQIGG